MYAQYENVYFFTAVNAFSFNQIGLKLLKAEYRNHL